MRVEQKTILITGATGFIGKHLTRHLVESGAKVIAISRKQENLKNLKAYVGESNNLITIEKDLLEESAIQEIVETTKALGLKINHIINNARTIENLKRNKEGVIEEKDFINEMKLNVYIPYLLVNTFVKASNKDLKSVVNMSSMYSIVVPNPKLYREGEMGTPINYGVAKSALNKLTKEMAVQHADIGLRVNAIAFGGVKGKTSDDFIKRYSNMCPSGNMLEMEEVLGPIDFLISSGSSGINGHVLIVDGGWSLW